MASDTPTQQSEQTYQASATPQKVDHPTAEFHSLRDDASSAADTEKYRRARNHISGLGHVTASDVFKNYKRSWLTPFFGSNEVEPVYVEEKSLHPCQLFSRDVHHCLEKNDNQFALCQSRVAAFQHCLREFAM